MAQRTRLNLTGPQARPWLNDLVTADLAVLDRPGWHVAALLSPQGKIQFEMMLRADGEDVELEIAADLADAMIQRLMHYRLRARIGIERGATGFVALHQNESAGTERDHRFGALCVARHWSDGVTDAGDSEALRVRQGVAEMGADYGTNEVFPHDVNLDVTGGVSFRKGCYVGQEVVSRMHHRGTARRRLAIIEAVEDGAGPLPARAELVADTGERLVGLGQTGTVDGLRALAIVRTDRVGEAQRDGWSIRIGARPVRILLPQSAPYDFVPAAHGDA